MYGVRADNEAGKAGIDVAASGGTGAEGVVVVEGMIRGGKAG